MTRGRSMGMDEWMQLVADCKLAGKGFDLRALRKVHAHCVPHHHEGLLEARLLLPHFVMALTLLSFQRSNAAWLEALPPGTKPPRPLPDCLVELMQMHVIPNAQRDTSHLFREQLAADNAIHAVLAQYDAKLLQTALLRPSRGGRVGPVGQQRLIGCLRQGCADGEPGRA